MERRHLPLLGHSAQGPAHTKPEQREKYEGVPEKIARAFLKQRYPLTEQGERLKSTVAALLERGDTHRIAELLPQLPTVEQPHLELFQDLTLTAEQEQRIFGTELANIQVTKGCSHRCSFCAADAEGKVETMPFAAILKMAEKKRQYDIQIEKKRVEEWQGFKAAVDEKGYGFKEEYAYLKDALTELEATEESQEKKGLYLLLKNQLVKIQAQSQDPNLLFGTLALLAKMEGFAFLQAQQDEDFTQILGGDWGEGWSIVVEELINKYNIARADNVYGDWLEKGARYLLEAAHVPPQHLFRELIGGKAYSLTNFYDSDPFDYRDPTFLHQDGTRADFGDVFIALSSGARPVHVTTAGWRRGDKVAARAATKIVQACAHQPLLMFRLRISINNYEWKARKDLDEYAEDMERVITALAPLGPKCLFLYESKVGAPRQVDQAPEPMPQNTDFVKRVCSRLVHRVNQIDQEGKVKISYPLISGYTPTPLREQTASDSNHDVMACMPGYHIWPDGTIAYQKPISESDEKRSPGQQTPLGSRPTPMQEHAFRI